MPHTEKKISEDLCFVNGAIYTCNPQQPWAEAIAVKGGRIVAIGDRAEVETAAGPDCRRIDLDGRMAMPGIIDGHNHVLEGARGQLFELQLGAHMSFKDILAAIENYASQPGRNEWVVGAPFLLANCPEMETVAGRRALDASCHGRPVMLRDLAFHSRFANSLALQRAGVSRDTTDPANGVIVRDAAGEPTGLFHESAGDLIENAVPPLSRDEWLACGRRSMKLLNGVGVTGFGLAAASAATLGALKQLDEAGELTTWAAGFMLMEPLLLALERDGVGEELVARRANLRSPHLGVDFAKFFMDGVPLMRTAAFIEPYLPDPRFPPGFSGHASHSVDSLAERIAKLDREGISVKVHTIGDRAIRDVLDAIEIVRATNPVRGARHSIAHLVYIQDSDIARLRQLDVIADLNPPMWFPSPNMTALRGVVGDARVDRSWPIRDIIESGALAATGTDWPALAPTPNPWPGLSGMVTRKNPTGQPSGVHRPDQALDLATALTLYTINAAESLRLRDVTGSLEIGKSADLIVLDRNLFDIRPEEIAATSVLSTYFEGRLVHGM